MNSRAAFVSTIIFPLYTVISVYTVMREYATRDAARRTLPSRLITESDRSRSVRRGWTHRPTPDERALFHAVNRGDIWMIYRGQQLRFAFEAGHILRIVYGHLA